MQRSKIIHWLRETDPGRLDDLWRLADKTRQENVGGEVHLRGLIELSNHCIRLCGYCGLRAANAAVKRYRMSDDEVLACARQAVEYGYGTVVLQSGEDRQLTRDRVATLIRRIKSDTPLAVTLSLGERSDDELAEWRRAGADRYLLRFETSNRELYERIHPPRADQQRSDRLSILDSLRRLGYEVGSGVMIGIPGQTYDDLTDDIELFGRLDLDMIGVGPYLCHPDTPMADRRKWPDTSEGEQVPADETTTCKVIALTRLVCPRANIPATTALAALSDGRGRELGLVRGANVIMPNITPQRYRILYEIYPDKACIAETGDACCRALAGQLETLNRRPGQGRGDSPNYRR